jgi:Family of unknown function (DUF6350)
MTSLLSPPRSVSPADLRHRRPLLVVALLGGAAAAAGTLMVCLGLGVAGWFLADAGVHGAPRDGLRVGGLAWLMAHGSGVRVQGAWISAVPLGISVVCAWAVWRLGSRVGDSVSGHGPDADRIADGERDWTVPSATVLFGLGYAAVAALALSLASDAASQASPARTLTWVAALTLLVAGPSIAVGSGRMAIWLAPLPPGAVATLATAGRILRLFLLVGLLAFVVALAVDAAEAANVVSQLHADTGATVAVTAVSASVVPNAAVFAGAYLLGPGFAVGAGTLVAPTAVVLGPLPLFPMLAALPGIGAPPAWAAYLMVVPTMTAVVATVRAQRRYPTLRWDHGALRGGVGGVLAGIGFAVAAALAGGSVGPGRMQEVGPVVVETLTHAVPAFGLGGLVGGLIATAWQRRRARATVA